MDRERMPQAMSAEGRRTLSALTVDGVVAEYAAAERQRSRERLADRRGNDYKIKKDILK
jgi:hypothetical protein